MIETISAVLLVAGAGFMLIASLGLLRMPDLFNRMHASTKAGALGVGFSLLAVAVYFHQQIDIVTRALAAVVFVILTAPVGAHMIGRAAYLIGVPFWQGTFIDEMKGRYDREAGDMERTPFSGPVAEAGDRDKPAR
jgi:multicomponent Na+:H+ antiporter subunit G